MFHRRRGDLAMAKARNNFSSAENQNLRSRAINWVSEDIKPSKTIKMHLELIKFR